MNTYITIPARYLMGRKLRTVLTTLAVVFGVAVIFAMNMILPSMTSALEASAMGVTGEVDMTIVSAAGNTFPAETLSTVVQTKGVAAAAPAFKRQVTLPTGSKTPQFDVIGLDPTRAETVKYYPVTGGRFLKGDDTNAVVISQQLAQAAGLKVGDNFNLPTPGGLSELAIIGLFNSQNGDQVLVPLKTAQTLFDAPGQLTSIDVNTSAGSSRDVVKQALRQKLGSTFSVGSAAASSAFAQTLQLGGIIFNMVGILTLFMGAFLIFNTFRTLVVERRHDIGMLRAVGATRGTITRLIVVESTVQGVVGTLLGLVLGYLFGIAMIGALQGVLEQFVRIRIGNPEIPLSAVLFATVLGIGMTVLAGLLPAISAGKVPVMVALRGEQVDAARRHVTIGNYIGAGLVLIGVGLLFTGDSIYATLGGVLVLIGMVMLAPLLLNPIARALEPVTRWIFAREGLLAEGNMERNPGRSSVTMSALMIALAVIVALYAVFSSVQYSYVTNLQKTLGADILLVPPSLGVWTGVVGVTGEFEQKLGQIPGVGNVAGLSYAPGQVQGATAQLMGLDPVAYPKVSSIMFTQGNDSTYAELGNGRNAIASGLLASSLGLKVGDTVPVQTSGGPKDYRIVGLGADFTSMKLATLYISKQNMAADFGSPEDAMAMASLAPGADAGEVKANVGKLLQTYPQLTLYWGADYRAQTANELSQLFGAFYVILIALVIPSMLGLINTLAINVIERTREIGVLRAIGATQSQVRRLVVAESLLIAMAGTALGLLAGLVLGYAMVSYIGTSVYATSYFFPWTGILVTIAVALIVALVASLVPARQAARVKIVQALQYE